MTSQDRVACETLGIPHGEPQANAMHTIGPGLVELHLFSVNVAFHTWILGRSTPEKV